MPDFNKVLLVGNLTKDPELRYTPNGSAVCTLYLAINRRYKQNDEFKTETNYFNISVWRAQAESSAKYLSKGSSVLIEGRLKQKIDEKNGEKFSKIEVIADKVQFLSSRNKKVKEDSQNYSDNLPF